jgi:hypothetical protein
MRENLQRIFFIPRAYITEWEPSFEQLYSKTSLKFNLRSIDRIDLEYNYLISKEKTHLLERVKLLTNAIPFPYASEMEDDDGTYRIRLTEEKRLENDFIKYFVEYSIRFACYVDLYDRVPKKCSLDLPDVCSLLELGGDCLNVVESLTDEFPHFLDNPSIINMEKYFKRHSFDHEHILKMYRFCNLAYAEFGGEHDFWFENGDTFETGLRYKKKEPKKENSSSSVRSGESNPDEFEFDDLISRHSEENKDSELMEEASQYDQAEPDPPGEANEEDWGGDPVPFVDSDDESMYDGT